MMEMKNKHHHKNKEGHKDSNSLKDSKDSSSSEVGQVEYLSSPQLAQLAGEDLAPKSSKSSGKDNSDNDLSERGLEKRFSPIAIALIKVIGGQLIAGAAKAGVDVAKAHMDQAHEDFKDFDSARQAFTPEMAKDIYDNKKDPNIKGVACFAKGYCWDNGSRYLGPANIKFKWDIYNTDFDCFEMYPGAVVHSKGKGGYQNLAYYGVCKYTSGEYRC
ncbi:hypothetical protein HII31_10425 [Pseudocercospora fuligena]|uniref:DUF7888 domain-containing protein n=1 Tax=Pseudocercospora fuligena TaxID=685502 RepID=A0A8H6VEA2_9PEZI|nr:hypothetical protein HII31_10425 [Pseudocercospora fuligena]